MERKAALRLRDQRAWREFAAAAVVNGVGTPAEQAASAARVADALVAELVARLEAGALDYEREAANGEEPRRWRRRAGKRVTADKEGA